jgi:hypothetical protein
MSFKSNDISHKCSFAGGICPVPNTHHRLEEIHQLWQQAAQTYHEPTKFRTNVNAIIQAIRNLTFALQNERHNIPGFEEWYEKWRERLRTDKLMRWLHNARNQVMKRGDLSVASRARVVVRNWREYPILETDVSPFLSAKKIALAVRSTLPEDVINNLGGAVIFVERRWCVSELPEQELLDIFSHAYRELGELVKEAHRLCGYEMRTPESGIHMKDQEEPSCFAELDRIRTAYINPQNGELIDFSKVPFSVTEGLAQTSMKRYGLDKVTLQGPRGNDPFEHAKALLVLAKKILVRDGFHYPMAFLVLPGGDKFPMALEFESQEDKYVVYREVAKEVEARRAMAVILVNEVWLAAEDESVGRRPSESPNRKEALQVFVACADGRRRSYTTVFRGDLRGRIKLGETHIGEGGQIFVLNPILDVWARWGKTASDKS